MSKKNSQPNFGVTNSAQTTSSEKPQAPTGHLVKGSIIDAPAIFINDTIYDLKSVKDGWSGKSNDHELGKVNDVGMKVGGLAVASYLFSQRTFPKTKAMEFIGFASFFGSMALWPKIAISAPAYLIHGFNPQKRYVDSFGRKKPVFQDRQYIPFDLYSDAQINKIGDRLNVPKNIENRRTVIQDKMAKIAVQNNTLWMMTAGFATPVMSALICNQLEKPVEAIQRYFSKENSKHALSKIKKLSEKYAQENAVDSDVKISNSKEFEAVIKKYMGKELTENAYSEIAMKILPTAVPFHRHLKALFETEEFLNVDEKVPTLNDEVIENLYKKIIDVSKTAKSISPDYADVIESSVPTLDELKNSCKKFNGKKMTEDVSTAIETLIKTKAIGNLGSDDFEDIEELTDGLHKLYLNSDVLYKYIPIKRSDVTLNATEEAIKDEKRVRFNSLDDKKIAKLREINQKVQNFKSETSVFDEYMLSKIEDNPDSQIAADCNKVRTKLLDILGIKQDDIKDARCTNSTAKAVVRKRLEQLTSDDRAYEGTVEKLAKAIKGFLAEYSEADKQTFDASLDKTYNHFAKVFTELGLEDTAKLIYGQDNYDLASTRYNVKSRYQMRLDGVRGTFLNILHNLDLYRRISQIEKLSKDGISDSEKMKIRDVLGALADSTIPTARKQEIAELAKNSISFHSSDYENRFQTKRENLTNVSDLNFADLIVKDGKVIAQKASESANFASEKVATDYDSNFYKHVMNFLFNSGYDETTEKVLNEKGILNDLENFRCKNYDTFGNITPPTRESLKVTDFEFLKTVAINHYYDLKGCKDFGDLNGLLVSLNYEGYKDLASLKVLMQKAGISGVKNIEDLKSIADVIQHNYNENEHKFYPEKISKYVSTSESKFHFLGQTFDECVNHIANEKFNSGKWLKSFSIFGAGLLGITVLAQLFFGKTSKTEKENMQVKKG